jgi:hypothetical protein
LLLNELAQWAVLLALAVFVVGLTRQLGDFLIPPRERVEQSYGPGLGVRLPAALLPEPERTRLIALMDERGSEWAAVLVVSGECTRCSELLERLVDEGAPSGVPVVGLSMTSDETHRSLLNQAVDIAMVDPESLDAENLHVKPFVLVVDRDLVVRHKQLAFDLREVARTYGAKGSLDEVGDPLVTRGAGSQDELTIVRAGG